MILNQPTLKVFISSNVLINNKNIIGFKIKNHYPAYYSVLGLSRTTLTMYRLKLLSSQFCFMPPPQKLQTLPKMKTMMKTENKILPDGVS